MEGWADILCSLYTSPSLYMLAISASQFWWRVNNVKRELFFCRAEKSMVRIATDQAQYRSPSWSCRVRKAVHKMRAKFSSPSDSRLQIISSASLQSTAEIFKGKKNKKTWVQIRIYFLQFSNRTNNQNVGILKNYNMYLLHIVWMAINDMHLPASICAQRLLKMMREHWAGAD